MRFLDQISSSEAAATGFIAAGNGWYFARYASRTRRPARKLAAVTLVLVNLAFAVEAALYLTLVAPAASVPENGAALFARSLALLAVASISALVLRQRLSQGNGDRP